MNAIFQRRSIRKYTDQDVSHESIKKLLAAAMSAPSAGNERPWHFIVVKDKERLAQLSNASPYAKMTKEASVAIIVCGDLSLEKFQGYWVQDCSAATQNILLEVTELGLGAVWLGIYPLQDRVQYIQNLFSLPEHVVPFSVIPVGDPAQSPDAPDRYEESRVHHEVW